MATSGTITINNNHPSDMTGFGYDIFYYSNCNDILHAIYKYEFKDFLS